MGDITFLLYGVTHKTTYVCISVHVKNLFQINLPFQIFSWFQAARITRSDGLTGCLVLGHINKADSNKYICWFLFYKSRLYTSLCLFYRRNDMHTHDTQKNKYIKIHLFHKKEENADSDFWTCTRMYHYSTWFVYLLRIIKGLKDLWLWYAQKIFIEYSIWRVLICVRNYQR